MPKKDSVITMENLDQANSDISFIRAFVDMMFTIDGGNQIDGLQDGTISSMCFELRNKIDSLKKFVDSVPSHAYSLSADTRRHLPADVVKRIEKQKKRAA